jgi:DNA-binding protein
MSNGENVVLVGSKPVMNYVIACLTLFNSGANEVIVKARGRAIERAIDTVEMLRRSFMTDLEIKDINIDTQELQRLGKRSSISTMEIIFSKPKLE